MVYTKFLVILVEYTVLNFLVKGRQIDIEDFSWFRFFKL